MPCKRNATFDLSETLIVLFYDGFLSVTSVHDIVWNPQTLNFDEYWTDWMAHGSNGLLDHPTGND